MNIVHVDYPPPLFAMTPRALSSITDLIIHHTAGSPTQTPLEIDQEHRNLNPPDAMIAYNYVIGEDGTVYDGRPIDVYSAASYGRNAESVAVVLTGNFQEGAPGSSLPTDAQITSLKLAALYLHIQIPSITRTYGHGDIAKMFYPDNTAPYATECPGTALEAKIPDVRSYVLANAVRH
jgi:N-acetylmuramoyl-L-alanine amidase